MEPKLPLQRFGSPQVIWQGKALGGSVAKKARALLIYLAVAGRAHSREALAELLWADRPTTKRDNLKKALNQLRNHEGVPLVEEGQQLVALNLARCWVDVAEFMRLTSDMVPNKVDALRHVEQLYQGDFLAGFNTSVSYEFEAWALGERTRFKVQMVAMLQSLADGYVQRHDLAQAIATVRRLLHLGPWREEAHCRLMELVARSGDRSAALRQFEICRQLLAKELAVEPSPETLALYEQIRTGRLETGAWESGPGSKGDNGDQTTAGSQSQSPDAQATTPSPPDATFPAFLTEATADILPAATAFVARTVELAQLVRLQRDL